MAYLYVIQGPDQGVRKDIKGSIFRIGRDTANDLKLRDTEVSRYHAEIRVTDLGLEVHDLQSSNGTFVNGVACENKKLHSGDRLLLGRTHFVVSDWPTKSRQDAKADVLLDATENTVSRIIQSATPQIAGRYITNSG